MLISTYAGSISNLRDILTAAGPSDEVNSIQGPKANTLVLAQLAVGQILNINAGDGNDRIFYFVPISGDVKTQGAAIVTTGNDIIGGVGPAEIDLGKGNDFVLPGFGSIVNADGDPTRGKDVIFTANDVQLNNCCTSVPAMRNPHRCRHDPHWPVEQIGASLDNVGSARCRSALAIA